MCKNEKNFTFECLNSLLTYNPITGELFWNGSRRGRCLDGLKPIGSPNSRGYLRTMINGQRLLVHRIIWFLSTKRWPDKQIDHINGIKHDNRLSNLREATGSENQCNRGIQKNNNTGIRGVYYSKWAKKYAAQIRINKKNIFLGYYNTLYEAKITRREAETKYFGEFAPNYKLFI